MRLDQYLISKKMAPSRSQLARWITDGHVTVNGAVSKPSYVVRDTDVIEVKPPEIKPSILVPEEIALDVLYEDADLLVINKSSHMVVHPGAGHRQGTLVHALLNHCRGLSAIGGVERPGIVHRLDKGTSGVMVVAKNDRAHLDLSRQFKEHGIKKIYWAVVYGVPRQKEAAISKKIGRHPKDRKKFAVNTTGKESHTQYKLLHQSQGLSLLEVQITTGRTHQIRVHLTDAGHSLVGDAVYGGHLRRVKNLNSLLKMPVQNLTHPLLHARQLELTHPISGKRLSFEAPLPDDYKMILDLLGHG